LLEARGDSSFALLQLFAPEAGEEGVRTFSLKPARIAIGRVLDADTGKPVANARVHSDFESVEARTDSDGRFRLALLDEGGVSLQVYSPEGEPYLDVEQFVEWPQGAIQHQVEIKLPRGVFVHGKVTEAGSAQSDQRAPVFRCGTGPPGAALAGLAMSSAAHWSISAASSRHRIAKLYGGLPGNGSALKPRTSAYHAMLPLLLAMANLTPHPAFLPGKALMFDGLTEHRVLGCRTHHGDAAGAREC
jgi:hypothetical protein